jgi:trimeric autotransporter adhesin
MKKTLLFILLVCLSNMARAQAPTFSVNARDGSETYAYNISGNSNAFGKFSLNNNVSLNQTGSVAREIETIIKKVNDNFNGVNALQKANDDYSIRYAEFVLPLVKAVQELTVLLDEQHKEIIALKKQIAANGTEVDKSDILARKDRVARLSQNYVNKFSTETEIGVSLPEMTTNANLIFYTLEGKQLRLLHLYNRGDFTVKIDRNELTRGICFYALMIDGKMIDSKQLLTK